ncbi:MAG: SRPBCC family protein [Chlamydiae bacterium]|nr:SRPBCC family protein [Chlamydiota bacterium]
MVVELTHTEFAKATPENVWKMWSDVSTWSKWDHGVEWCKLKEGSKFELNGEASLLPKGSPFPLNIRLIECTPNKSFTDEGKFEFGSIQFSHKITPYKDGVKITHSLKYIPANPKAKEMFEMRMLPKIQKELPESVKALAKFVEEKSQKTKIAR